MIGQGDPFGLDGRTNHWDEYTPTVRRMLEKTGLTGAARWLEDNFARLVAEHDVPGATVAVLAEGRVATATGGVTSLRT